MPLPQPLMRLPTAAVAHWARVDGRAMEVLLPFSAPISRTRGRDVTARLELHVPVSAGVPRVRLHCVLALRAG